MGLNAALATAARSLEVFSTGVQVAGQNIANAATPGYIREEVNLEPSPSYRRGQLVLGTGVFAQGVQQQIDLYLETRVHSANTDAAAAGARERIYKQLEAELRELGSGDLSTSLSEFVQALANVADQPEMESFRQLAVAEGVELAQAVQSLRTRIDSLRQAQSVRIDSLVEEANGLIDEIARLNPRIAQLEAAGSLRSDAGAERSQRYAAMNRLAEIMPVRFRENPNGTVDVFSGSEYLILSSTIQHLVTTATTDRGVSVQSIALDKTQADITRVGGELRGIAEGRDDVLGEFVEQLDQLAAGLIGEFNQLHAAGEGRIGFESVTSRNRVADTTAALNAAAAGLAFTPQHGSFELRVRNQVTGLIETTTVTVDLDGIGPDTSLDDLRAAVDAVANVTATVTPLGQLQLQTAPGFEVRFAEDSSDVLAALGINTFFTGSNSADISVDAAVQQNADLFAAGLGDGPADGRNASRFVEFLENPLNTLGGRSLSGYYDFVVTEIAHSSATETTLTEGLTTFRDSLLSQRSQFSGVSLDEEAIRIIEFQRAYQASARIITTVDELFQTLLSM